VGCGRHGNHHGLCRRHAALAEYRRDPTKAKAKSARRRYQAARGMDAVDKDLSLSYRKAIAADPCLYCGAPGTEVDHFYPLAKGGTDAWWNLCMACVVCNRRKHAHCGTWLALGGPSREPKYRRRQLRQSRRRARRHVAQAD
jgi:5-methylcytosine-specific restriction endonuclease McrA